MKEQTLEGQTAIVTGGSTGIGSKAAEILAERGASVMVCARNTDNLEETVNKIKSFGRKAIAFRADVSRKEEVEALFAACIKEFGNPDILVSNAGAGLPPRSFSDITEADIDHVFGVNVKGQIWCLQQCMKYMNEGGRIVVTGSSSVSYPVEGLTTYIASKSALRAVIDTTKFEFGKRRISINEVQPGLTRTPMVDDLSPEFLETAAKNSPLGRIGEPEDVAEIIAFLCEKRSRWLSGQHIIANGGSNS